MTRGGWKNWKGPSLLQAVNNAGREAVRKTAYIILEASMQQVPHDEGTLMRSGIVLMAPDGSPEGLVCFGGGSGTGHPIIPYAVRWHENQANFQKGRKRFYLKDPVNKLGPSTLNKAIQTELGRLMR